MRLALIFLLVVSITASATAKPSGVTRCQLTAAQIQEFDETGWITLTPGQKTELRQRAGIAPTRVRPIYDRPDGEVAEFGYNLALKTATDKMEILHEFLRSDADVAEKYRTKDQAPPVTVGKAKDIPSFAIDADGKLWRWISRKEFQDYVARDPKNIRIIYFQLPSSMPSKNTVASTDTLRQVTNDSKRQDIPTYVVSQH